MKRLGGIKNRMKHTSHVGFQMHKGWVWRDEGWMTGPEQMGIFPKKVTPPNLEYRYLGEGPGEPHSSPLMEFPAPQKGERNLSVGVPPSLKPQRKHLSLHLGVKGSSA
jgi:hypothetical protein